MFYIIINALWRTILIYKSLVFSILFATAILTPQLLLFYSPNYQGIAPLVSSDEDHYTAIVHEAMEGRWKIANTYIWEEKTKMSQTHLWISSVILGNLLRLVPMNIGAFIFLWKWIGITLISWLLLQILVTLYPQLFFSQRAATVIGFFVLPLLLGPSFFSRLFKSILWSPAWAESLSWTRFANPVVSGMLLLGCLLIFFRLAEQPTKRYALLFGFLAGALAWIYFFFWIFISSMLGLWTVFNVLQNKREISQKALIALSINAIVAMPFLWILARASVLPTNEISYLGLIHTHAPIIEKTTLASVVLFLCSQWVVRKKKKSYHHQALTCFALTLLIAVNHQVITGRSLQPNHFFFIIDLPFAGLLLLLACWNGLILINASAPVKQWVGVVAALIFFASALGVQMSTIKNFTPDFIRRQRFMPAFVWIQNQGTPYVVLSNEELSELIPMYSRADVAFAAHANTYKTTSPERGKWAWLIREQLNTNLEPKSREAIYASFLRQKWLIGSYLFEPQYYRQLCGSQDCFPDLILQNLAEDFKDFTSHSLEYNLKKYRVDAILWDEEKNPEWSEHLHNFQRVWSGNHVSIWKLP